MQLWSSSGPTRASARGSLLLLWVLTRYRVHLDSNKMASHLEVSSLSRRIVCSLVLTLRLGQQDDTPTKWDTRYYSQTQAKVAPRGVYRFDSDVNLANPNTTSGEAFTEFANDRGTFHERMKLLHSY